MLSSDLCKDIQHEIELSYEKGIETNMNYKQVDMSLFTSFIRQMKEILLPEYYADESRTKINVEKKIQDISELLCKLCAYECEDLQEKQLTVFFRKLPYLRSCVLLDIKAAYDNDPAARNYYIIAISYPGISLIINHRISHELHILGYPTVARILSEITHSQTGIDIHPGAKIGESFFIDHGTGIVIGETTEIGSGVSLYQGVTLGSFSISRDTLGNVIKGNKRHPTIEDHVRIYAGATILGGNTVIGTHSIIGGNVWLTKSVPAYSKVTSQPNITIAIGENNSSDRSLFAIS